MEYKAVESSQIEAVAHDPETNTLGIKFPPNKKQREAGLPGSEYYYVNITPEFYTALLNAKTDPDFESVGKFFGKLIKPFPDKYPFVKVA